MVTHYKGHPIDALPESLALEYAVENGFGHIPEVPIMGAVRGVEFLDADLIEFSDSSIADDLSNGHDLPINLAECPAPLESSTIDYTVENGTVHIRCDGYDLLVTDDVVRDIPPDSRETIRDKTRQWFDQVRGRAECNGDSDE